MAGQGVEVGAGELGANHLVAGVLVFEAGGFGDVDAIAASRGAELVLDFARHQVGERFEERRRADDLLGEVSGELAHERSWGGRLAGMAKAERLLCFGEDVSELAGEDDGEAFADAGQERVLHGGVDEGLGDGWAIELANGELLGVALAVALVGDALAAEAGVALVDATVAGGHGGEEDATNEFAALLDGDGHAGLDGAGGVFDQGDSLAFGDDAGREGGGGGAGDCDGGFDGSGLDLVAGVANGSGGLDLGLVGGFVEGADEGFVGDLGADAVKRGQGVADVECGGDHGGLSVSGWERLGGAG